MRRKYWWHSGKKHGRIFELSLLFTSDSPFVVVVVAFSVGSDVVVVVVVAGIVVESVVVSFDVYSGGGLGLMMPCALRKALEDLVSGMKCSVGVAVGEILNKFLCLECTVSN